MIICHNCFKDKILQSAIFERSINLGYCEFCHEEGKLYYTESESYLEDDYFSAFLDTFTPVSQLSDYPRGKGRLLQTEVAKYWGIFSTEDDAVVYEMLKSICKNRFQTSPDLFEEKIGIKESIDKSYIKDYTLLRGQSWDDFVRDLKYRNRFHSNYLNLDILKMYCSYLSKYYEIGNIFYRCRIADTEFGYEKKEMGAPPEGKSSDGRANAKGVQILYLGDSDKTVIHETRSGQYDYVAIGKFSVQTPLTVVDFKAINDISPFEEGIIDNIKQLALNKDAFNQINAEMSRVMRRSDDVLDYLPTQYITDFVRSIVDENGKSIYSGIEYRSVMNNRGYNLAIFDIEKFNCIDVTVKQITNIIFDY